MQLLYKLYTKSYRLNETFFCINQTRRRERERRSEKWEAERLSFQDLCKQTRKSFPRPTKTFCPMGQSTWQKVLLPTKKWTPHKINSFSYFGNSLFIKMLHRSDQKSKIDEEFKNFMDCLHKLKLCACFFVCYPISVSCEFMANIIGSVNLFV